MKTQEISFFQDWKTLKNSLDPQQDLKAIAAYQREKSGTGLHYIGQLGKRSVFWIFKATLILPEAVFFKCLSLVGEIFYKQILRDPDKSKQFKGYCTSQIKLAIDRSWLFRSCTVTCRNLPEASFYYNYMFHTIDRCSIPYKVARAISGHHDIAALEDEKSLNTDFSKLETELLQSSIRHKKVALAIYFGTRRLFKKRVFFPDLSKTYTEVIQTYEQKCKWAEARKTLVRFKKNHKLWKQRPQPLVDNKGVCRGAALWFIHLYLNSKKSMKDPHTHIESVAKRFEKGIPSQGVLLQRVMHDSSKLLGHNINTSASLRPLDLKADPNCGAKTVKNLQNGIYYVGGFMHAVVLVKHEDGTTYSWDSNYGLRQVKPDEYLEDLQKSYLPDLFEDAENDFRQVKFARHSLSASI